VGVEVAGDLTIRSRQKWTLQNKYRLEDAQTEPMISLIAKIIGEYTLRYVVGYKERRITKSELFTRILTEIETTNGAVKMASATFQLVQALILTLMSKKTITSFLHFRY
jgi:two-component SAPR family response regulator